MKNYLTTFILLTCSAWAKTIEVVSTKELETAVVKAAPGDHIVIKDGTYQQPINLQGKGNSRRPIIVRAETLGKVTFQKPITLSGSWVTLSGIKFTGMGSVSMKGTGLRLCHSTISNSESKTWVNVYLESTKIEIDHCLFENKTNNTKHQRGCPLLQINVLNEKEQHHIHHNHFRDVAKGATSNGYETIQLITKSNPFNPKGGDSETVIENNLFERCNGEGEIISIKSNGNVIQHNTFLKCVGELVLRSGHRNQALENIFIGDGEKWSGGIRITGKEQVVSGNYFLGLGRSAITFMDGTPDDLYVSIERARIEKNVILDCSLALRIGQNHSKHPIGTAPEKSIIADNYFINTESNNRRLIEFVQSDEPKDFTWSNNKYRGTLGISTNSGLKTTGIQPRIKELTNKALSENKVGPGSK